MKKIILVQLLLIVGFLAHSQQSIDGSFPFQTDPAKKYSIYIPSGYSAAEPSKLMLGLHPLNTMRWDAESWRDTLIAFAEETQVILLCPDGGSDGRIDDPIDTAFTSALLDSAHHWYTIDSAKQYVMGFSWGGLTTYTYGLRRTKVFSGFIPIGAAINGAQPISSFIGNADGTPWYLVHGSQDSPGTRFLPLKDSLEAYGAILNDTLMPGIGHTIDFPNRNMILVNAFHWIDSVNCTVQDTTQEDTALFVRPLYDYSIHVYASEKVIVIENSTTETLELELFSLEGKRVRASSDLIREGQNSIAVPELKSGFYIVRLRHEDEVILSKKVFIAP